MSPSASPSAVVTSVSDVHCRIGLTHESLLALADELARLELGEYATEYRLDAAALTGEQWVIYWKLRAGETRLLLAHPEKDQWVGTCAMAAPFAQNLGSALRALAPSAILKLPQTPALGAIARSSNFGLEIERLLEAPT